MNPLQPHILMCPPDFYGIHYEINPWMDITRQADHATELPHRHPHSAHQLPELLERPAGDWRQRRRRQRQVPVGQEVSVHASAPAAHPHPEARVPGRNQLQRDHPFQRRSLHRARGFLEHLAAVEAQRSGRRLPESRRELRHQPLIPESAPWAPPRHA